MGLAGSSAARLLSVSYSSATIATEARRFAVCPDRYKTPSGVTTPAWGVTIRRSGPHVDHGLDRPCRVQGDRS